MLTLLNNREHVRLKLTALSNIPLINAGDDLSRIVVQALQENGVEPAEGDIVAIAQKIVSKSEGREVKLADVSPSKRAIELAVLTGKDPRLVQLILQERRTILRVGSGVIICQDHKGLVCPNAGIDLSNVSEQNRSKDVVALLLPRDADRSASRIREQLIIQTGHQIGVLIVDSHGRPWRKRSIGTCIGLAGIPAVIDLRSSKDLFGRRSHGVKIAVADELAAAASLVIGQNTDRTPMAHICGFPHTSRESSTTELYRPRDRALFSKP